MGADEALFLLNEMLWTAVYIAGPILLATLLVGLFISAIQVTTQLQEITLSYVPKITVAALLLFVLGPWMLDRLVQFAVSLYQLIPGFSS